jgi:hypothetical protein
MGQRRTSIFTGIGLCLFAAACVAGCEPVRPWERRMLAHPTMSVDDVAQGIDEHVRAVSEGAAGGISGGGGGCGCN